MSETKINTLNNIDYSLYDDLLPVSMRGGKLALDYQNFIESIDINNEETTISNIEYIKQVTDLFLPLAFFDGKENVIANGNLFMELSNKGRLKLTRGSDLINSFEFVEYPNDQVESATLYLSIDYPKDEEKRKLWLEDKLDKQDDCFYLRENRNTIYYPLKRLENIKGQFSFYSKPLPMFTFPFSGLSIELKINSEFNIPRIIKMNCGMIGNDLRQRLSKEKYEHYCKLTRMNSKNLVTSGTRVKVL
jgi:hypothetical protein